MEFVPGTRNTKIHGLRRVQIPMMTVVRENLMYGYLDLVCVPEFVEFWRGLEEKCKMYADPTHEWRSSIEECTFKVKFDEKTHIFDGDSNLIEPPSTFIGETVTCILEIKSVYKFKGACGITCRIHQMKIHSKEKLRLL